VKSGTTTVCSITLASAKGTCVVAAAKLAAGSDRLVASYGGAATFATSTGAAVTLTVAKATTSTTLALSATSVVIGKETVEKLSVTVAPQYAGTTATGTVTIKSRTTTLCTITLAAGKGTCALKASALAVGSHSLTAAYGGSVDFAGSTSAAKTLKVT
jgi:hypothetical protein